MEHKVLIVDDEEIVRLSFSRILGGEGFFPLEAFNCTQAVEVFENERPDAVLLDLKIPDGSGIDIMRRLHKIDRDAPVIIITGYGNIETAVEAIKHGAYDFILKPPKPDRLVFTLKRALEKLELTRKLNMLNASFDTSLEWLVGKSDGMKGIIEQVRHVAPSNFSVIIHGETGTGKTVIAHAIHNLSGRAGKDFVKVDAGAIPETLFESELFGYEKGAFTGADKTKKGFFEAADRGTLFIDEIQNINLSVQGKLLSAVEEKKMYRLGSNKHLEVDARIIAATNSDLRKSVRDGKIREDLFFRLGEFIISIPPLRERKDDIMHFTARFIVEAAGELNKHVRMISDDALELFMGYSWPGNVRELKNVIRRAVLTCDGDEIKSRHIDFLIADKCCDSGASAMMPLKELSAMAVRDVEKKAIRQALDIAKGNKTKAAAILQIDYKTLLTKIKDHGLK
jgi:DNA-binding NtrC family response regulator